MISFREEGFYPAIFALMRNRRQGLYTSIFEKVREVAGSPNRIMADFEMPMRRAMAETWGETSINGCFFHFSQAIIRKVRRTGLAEIYRNNIPFRKTIRQLVMSAFLRPNDIRQSLIGIREAASEAAIPIINYYQRFWIDTVGPEAFSVFGLEERTNNGSEAINRSLNRLLGVHPAFWTWISKLVSVHRVYEAELQAEGVRRRLARPIYTARNRAINSVSNRYANGSISSQDALERLIQFTPAIVDENEGLRPNHSDNESDNEIAEPQVVEPQVAEPQVAEPQVAEPQVDDQPQPQRARMDSSDEFELPDIQQIEEVQAPIPMPELDSDEEFPLMQGITGIDEDRLQQLRDWIIDGPRIQAIEDDVCPICLMENPNCRLQCGHTFHGRCLLQDIEFQVARVPNGWPKCAICRRDMNR